MGKQCQKSGLRNRMRWVTEEFEFKEVYLEAMTCVFIDSGREDTSLRRLTFDDANVCTGLFFDLLKTLMDWSEESSVYFTVMRPDPEDYYHNLLGIYPTIEIEKKDIAEQYIEALNKEPPKNGNNLYMYQECVITPKSRRWFVHAFRSSDDRGGHLWMPVDWSEKLLKLDRFDGYFLEAREKQSSS